MINIIFVILIIDMEILDSIFDSIINRYYSLKTHLIRPNEGKIKVKSTK
jgi:hypothetical protein